MTKIEELQARHDELMAQLVAISSQMQAIATEIEKEEWKTLRDVQAGTYKGETTYCPVNAHGDCPYCDKRGICHIEDPFADCDDWCAVCGVEDWDEWEAL